MDAIGGYFELADYGEGVFPHSSGILLNTGRNAMEYILLSIREKIHTIHIPYYTCDAVLEPLQRLGIPWTFYHIDKQFEIAEDIPLGNGKYLIANNYFGIKDAYIRTLAERYGDRLIVDCAQAFFAKPIPGIKTFYSPRKYVGVADGGVAYLSDLQDRWVEADIKEIDCTSDHDSHLYTRKQYGAEAGFAAYQANEKKLEKQPARWMSGKTRQILDHIDYEKVISRRRENYAYLHERLSEMNDLQLPDMETFVCPMAYPFMDSAGRNLRDVLIENKIFVARYWPNVRGFEDYRIEEDFANKLLPLPCDQRYGNADMDIIVERINN